VAPQDLESDLDNSGRWAFFPDMEPNPDRLFENIEDPQLYLTSQPIRASTLISPDCTEVYVEDYTELVVNRLNLYYINRGKSGPSLSTSTVQHPDPEKSKGILTLKDFDGIEPPDHDAYLSRIKICYPDLVDKQKYYQRSVKVCQRLRAGGPNGAILHHTWNSQSPLISWDAKFVRLRLRRGSDIIYVDIFLRVKPFAEAFKAGQLPAHYGEELQDIIDKLYKPKTNFSKIPLPSKRFRNPQSFSSRRVFLSFPFVYHKVHCLNQSARRRVDSSYHYDRIKSEL
jgi:hypothetical protein